MDSSADNKIADLVDIVKSWIPRRIDPPSSLSRDFWMPDHSCRVCYECDSQFTVFNRRHHCRLCGRVFCAKCTAHSIPAPSDEPRISSDDWERIRVCNYCFKQWELRIAVVDNGDGTNPNAASAGGLSLSPSATSLASTKSSCTCNSSCSTVGSGPYSTDPYHRAPLLYSSSDNHQQSQMDPAINAVEQDCLTSRHSAASASAFCSSSNQNQFGYCMSRSDDEDDDYSVYRSVSETQYFSNGDAYYGPLASDEIDLMCGPYEMHQSGNLTDAKDTSSSLVPESFDTPPVDIIEKTRDNETDEYEAPSYDGEGADAEPVDFENNCLLWLPPDPEDDEDDRDADLFDDDDEEEAVTGEWGYLRPTHSFGSGEFRTREKSSEEHRKAMKNVVEGHFRALVSQLLQVENLPVGDEDDHDSWLQIITSLSWEAAGFLKPDTSKSGGMDPGGYVKVKCIASGNRNESTVVKGVVCKKNVAHRRMMSKFDKPRFLILGGALEYQRVSNLLSSVDTLLQQEMDHLKMAVAKIEAHHPNVLLVEKSVSRYAQEYLLTKDISLVLNIKRPLLERIARCTGAQIVPSIDHLTSQKLGYCEKFHVEKFLEDHGSAGQGGKKLTKTLMFFEGCPRPLGCTILLKGASGDELKKVKHVVQYGVFAAYHLALETSFLADEGASLPELPLKSPINVALPDKPLKIDRSISTIPGFTIPGAGKPSGSQSSTEVQRSSVDTNELQKTGRGSFSRTTQAAIVDSVSDSESLNSLHLTKGHTSQNGNSVSSLKAIDSTRFLASFSPSGQDASGPCSLTCSSFSAFEENNKMELKDSSEFENAQTVGLDDQLHPNVDASVAPEQIAGSNLVDENALAVKGDANQSFLKQDGGNQNEEIGSSKEDFPLSPSDHQSILVSLSSRCVWKGTVCERAHLFRIKYYGSFDKPLGRFLRDHLFDQNYCCRSCDMPSEAHVHCYTHRQGSLTISVKKVVEVLLPGEREGKIWMWHRCLKCPRTNGFPPATRRVVMSDAAWGLSFGKFLELSFSNHAAASRVASCGHSLHRDCLRFYGFGRMVACFRYASINVLSVHLPPPKVEFNYDRQEWIQIEGEEVRHKAELLFTEVHKALLKIQEKVVVSESQNSDTSGSQNGEARRCIMELEAILQKEREEFEESLRASLSGEAKTGQPATDVLEINKLRRQIAFNAYVWDQRLIYAASRFKTNLQDSQTSLTPKLKEKLNAERLPEMDMARKPVKGFSSFDSFLLDTKPQINFSQGGNESQPAVHKANVTNLNPIPIVNSDLSFSSIANNNDNLDPCDSGKVVRRVHSEGEFPNHANLSDTLDAAWTGNNNLANMVSEENSSSLPPSASGNVVMAKSDMDKSLYEKGQSGGASSVGSASPSKMLQNTENFPSRGMPFPTFKSSLNPQKLGIGDYNPAYISFFKELERQNGAKLLLPIGINDTVIPVYDDEPTSIIAYALVSSDYHHQMSELERPKDTLETGVSLPLLDSVNLLSFNSFDDSASDAFRSFGSTDESLMSMSGSRGSQISDLLSYTKDLHVRASFTDDGPLGKVKYTVTCYFAKRFEALRRTCCPSELDFIRSLSRCKKWGAQGGKSNVFFAKTLDDRFIIKQVTKTELESFIKFGASYFKYLLESIGTGSPTCLAKILGIYQVSSKHLKGGKESKMDVLVMENLLFRRNITRLYDLKGSSRSRYNPDTSGNNKVLLDQNLIEAMPTSPIFVGNKAKRLLERAVWNDTSFLASVDVMDYSLLVGVDEERHELVLGIIDFMRQYTWDKHLETWVKTSGFLGGSRNTTPTVISPQQYKKRFRKAMTAYFLMVPDQWSPPTIIPSASHSDLCDETLHGGPSCD